MPSYYMASRVGSLRVVREWLHCSPQRAGADPPVPVGCDSKVSTDSGCLKGEGSEEGRVVGARHLLPVIASGFDTTARIEDGNLALPSGVAGLAWSHSQTGQRRQKWCLSRILGMLSRA